MNIKILNKSDQIKSLSYRTFNDKVHGGWFGKCLGGNIGASIKGWKRFNDMPMTDELFLHNSSKGLALQLLQLDLAKKIGPSIRETALADHWKTHCNFPQNAYGIALRNFELGIYPPESGNHNNHFWQNSTGSIIRSEIWGMLNPAMPEQAAYYASMDSSLDHFDFSIDAESFLAACTSLAFVENNFHDIFQQALDIFHQESPFTELTEYVHELYHICSFKNAVGKLKSRYGDADYSNAPMNVGFILLVLLFYDADFDNLEHALYLGHDSECICSSVASLWGVILGYEALAEKWKNRLKDELNINTELCGIYAPKNLTDLTAQTCQAAVAFIEFYNKIKLENAEPSLTPKPLPFNLNCIANYHPADLHEFQTLTLEFENITEHPMQVKLEIKSDELLFNEKTFDMDVPAFSLHDVQAEFKLNEKIMQALFQKPEKVAKQSFRYKVRITINKKPAGEIERGVPFYGVWMLLGPFIQDDEQLAPQDEKHPNHPDASLPSNYYKAHDKINIDTDFLDVASVRKIANEMEFDNHPFQIELIQPGDSKLDLSDFFRGHGEKTVYLYSKIHSKSATQMWLAMGCSTYLKVWWNGEQIYKHSQIRSAHPHDIALLIDLKKGKNDILLKIDMPVPAIELNFGFKTFENKQIHQCHWDTELVPMI